jgi:hypothetical protein
MCELPGRPKPSIKLLNEAKQYQRQQHVVWSLLGRCGCRQGEVTADSQVLCRAVNVTPRSPALPTHHELHDSAFQQFLNLALISAGHRRRVGGEGYRGYVCRAA